MGGDNGHKRIGIGLVGFTGEWLLETAIALRPPAIVSCMDLSPCTPLMLLNPHPKTLSLHRALCMSQASSSQSEYHHRNAALLG